MEINHQPNTHHGRAIKRIRETLGIKQEALADYLNVTQQCVSSYEQKKALDDEIINKIGAILNVSPELIKNLTEEPLNINIENNTFEKGSSNVGKVDGDNILNNNPIEQILELNKEK
ncbi:MAG: helix-turn-helix domain-containing protein [Prevotella sp.]|jgi:transcriptional regulator with XRE-family HTH domain|nr:helix-turn-helix domain-containing protein [Prevotella sp.]